MTVEDHSPAAAETTPLQKWRSSLRRSVDASLLLTKQTPRAVLPLPLVPVVSAFVNTTKLSEETQCLPFVSSLTISTRHRDKGLVVDIVTALADARPALTSLTIDGSVENRAIAALGHALQHSPLAALKLDRSHAVENTAELRGTLAVLTRLRTLTLSVSALDPPLAMPPLLEVLECHARASHPLEAEPSTITGPSLRRVCLWLGNSGEHLWRDFSQRLPALTSLDLSESAQVSIDPKGLAEIGHHPRLTELIVPDLRSEDVTLLVDAQAGRPTVTTLAIAPAETASALTGIARITTITSLDLTGGHSYEGFSRMNAAAADALSPLPLKSLSCHGFTPGAWTVVGGWASLQSLTVWSLCEAEGDNSEESNDDNDECSDEAGSDVTDLERCDTQEGDWCPESYGGSIKGFDAFVAATKIATFGFSAVGGGALFKAIARIQTLHTVVLLGGEFPASALGELSALPRLRTLEVRDGPCLNAVPIDSVPALNTLTKVALLAWNSGWRGDIGALVKLPRLAELVINDEATHIPVQAFAALGESTSLKKIDVTGFDARANQAYIDRCRAKVSHFESVSLKQS